MPEPQFSLKLDPTKLGTVPPMATVLDPDTWGTVPDALSAPGPDKAPVEIPDEAGPATSAWHWMNSPLAPQIADAAHAIANHLDAPTSGTMRASLFGQPFDLPPELAQARGLAAGMVGGAGDVAASLSSPISLVLLATGIGPESDALRKLPQIQQMLRMPQVQTLYKAVHGLAGAGFAGHGGYTAATAPTVTERLQGAAEFAMGAAGVGHAAEGTFLAKPVSKYLPHRAPGPRLVDPAAQAAATEALQQQQYQTALQDPRNPGGTPGGPPPPPSATEPPGSMGRTRAGTPWTLSETRRQELMQRYGGKAGQLSPEHGAEDMGQFGGEEPGPETSHDEPVPAVRVPTWIRNTESPGGRWVLPSGDFEAAPDARSAQTAMKERGLDPFSRTGVPRDPTEPMGLATIPKEEPSWEQGAEGGMPGFFSPLRRMVEALPDAGLPPARFLSMADKVVSPEEMDWKGVRQWVEDYKARNGDIPIPKADLQQLLENTRIEVKQVTQGAASAPYTVGETQPHALALQYSQPFPDYETWLQTAPEFYRRPGHEASASDRYIRDQQTHEYNQGQDRWTGKKSIPVTDAEGQGLEATITPNSDLDGGHAEGSFRAELPAGVAESPSFHPQTGAYFDGYSDAAKVFPTEAEAEAWIRERLKAGTIARPVGFASYGVPGPDIPGGGVGGRPQQKYREDLFTVPGEVPSNRVEADAFTNTAHYNIPNVVGTVRGQQDYTLPNPADPTGAGRLHGTLMDEAQADIHQKAHEARYDEIHRLRGQAAKTLMDANPGMTRKQAEAQTPLAPFEKQVPEHFGYRSREVGERLQAAKDAVKEANTAEDAQDDVVRALAQQLHDAQVERRGTAIREAGFANGVALQNAADSESYKSLSGRRYGASGPDDMSPEDAATFLRAVTVRAQLDSIDRTTAPDIQEMQTKLEAEQATLLTLRHTLEQARNVYRGIKSQVTDAIGGNLPYKGEGWHNLVAKRKIYEVAADPNQSFIGLVGGEENAARYNYARKFSKIRFNPETNKLHVYDIDGSEIRGSFGRGRAQVTVPVPIDASDPTTMLTDLKRYVPKEVAKALMDKIQSYEPVMKPGEPIERSTSRRGYGDYSDDPSDTNYRTNDPDDSDRYGTPRERRRAREEYEEREAESARESEREQWRTEKVEGDELDPDAEENAPYFAAQQEALDNRNAYVADHKQDLLPGFEKWTPEEVAQMLFPDPEVPEDAVHVEKWRAIADWFGRDELENEDHLFDTEREAEDHIESYVQSAGENMDIDYPPDEELYGPDGADLDDRYDPDFDPDAEDPDEDTDTDDEEAQYGPSVHDPAAHPTMEGLDLAIGGKGMFTFYDEVFKTRIERLLRPFGFQGEMSRVAIPSKENAGSHTYAWIAYLTPEMKAKIVKAGFSIMSVAMAMQHTAAPQEIKDWLLRAAILDARRNKQRDKGPGRMGATPTPTEIVGRGR